MPLTKQLVLIGGFALLCARAGLNAQIPGNVITFDVPGAGTGPLQGTFPVRINSWGDVAGNYKDSTGTPRAFIRYASGEIVTFEAPGALDNANGGTVALGINDDGIVAGYFITPALVRRGFIRTPDGTVTPFDAPGVQIPYGGTVVANINSAGVILGSFSQTSTVTTSFLRQPDGSFVIFDGPGTNYTNGRALNSYSVVTGDYYSSSGSPGFIRAASGTTSTFDVASSNNVEPESINDSGEVVGSYTASTPIRVLAFLRKPDGTTTSFQAPAQASKELVYTSATSINNAGLITGYYETPESSGAFLRTARGALSLFQIPNGQNTYPEVISETNAIAGYFCRKPCNGGGSSGFIIVP